MDEVSGGAGVREQHGVGVAPWGLDRGEVLVCQAGQEGEAVVVENNIHTLAVGYPTLNVHIICGLFERILVP